MLYIEKDAVEKARQTVQERLAEYKESVENGTAKDRRLAWDAYKEASDAWKSLLHTNYHI